MEYIVKLHLYLEAMYN